MFRHCFDLFPVPRRPRGETSSVSGVTHDSRSVRPGFAFVAVPGFRHDGTLFAAEAMRRGAALVVAERPVEGVPTAVVPDARAALSALARAVNGDPSAALTVFGVTGTNGKTTTSYVLHAVLSGARGAQRCGLMSTAETVSGVRFWVTSSTSANTGVAPT